MAIFSETPSAHHLLGAYRMVMTLKDSNYEYVSRPFPQTIDAHRFAKHDDSWRNSQLPFRATR